MVADGTRIIGIDPGLVTGICSFSVFDNEIHNPEPLEIDQMGLGHFMEHICGQWRLTGAKPQVVIESFIITPQTGKNSQAPWSLENIGIVRFFCNKAGIDLKFQTPAQAKKLITDDVLKTAGLYFKGKGHNRDAARHALYHLIADLKIKREILL